MGRTLLFPRVPRRRSACVGGCAGGDETERRASKCSRGRSGTPVFAAGGHRTQAVSDAKAVAGTPLVFLGQLSVHQSYTSCTIWGPPCRNPSLRLAMCASRAPTTVTSAPPLRPSGG